MAAGAAAKPQPGFTAAAPAGRADGGWEEHVPRGDPVPTAPARGSGGRKVEHGRVAGVCRVRRGRERGRLVPPPPKEHPVVIDVPTFDSELGFTQGFYDDGSQTMYIM